MKPPHFESQATVQWAHIKQPRFVAVLRPRDESQGVGMLVSWRCTAEVSRIGSRVMRASAVDEHESYAHS